MPTTSMTWTTRPIPGAYLWPVGLDAVLETAVARLFGRIDAHVVIDGPGDFVQRGRGSGAEREADLVVRAPSQDLARCSPFAGRLAPERS